MIPFSIATVTPRTVKICSYGFDKKMIKEGKQERKEQNRTEKEDRKERKKRKKDGQTER